MYCEKRYTHKCELTLIEMKSKFWGFMSTPFKYLGGSLCMWKFG